MPPSVTSLAYDYPVESLGAGGSYGNLDVFARTSRESDLQGLWYARDDTFYAGEMKVAPVVAGVPLPAAITRFHPAYQRTDYGGGVYVTHPCFKERDLGLSADLGLDLKNTELEMLDELNSQDKIRTAHLGLNFDNICWDGHNYATLYAYQGLGTFLDGMDDEDERASRREGDDTFTKFNLTFTRVQYFCDWLTVMLRTGGQLSTESLVASEQMQIGGADSVRGYDPGEHTGDSGYFASIEPRFTFCKEHWYVPQLAAFFDHAGVHRNTPLIGEGSADNLSGAGVGLRWDAPYSIDLRFDVGFPLADESVGENDDDGPKFYVAGSIKF
jgi:hemolysin activation/secretion protein